MKKNKPQHGSVFWVTGLSGSGKTTICRELVTYLRALGRSVVMLDGDELREAMGATNAHTRQQRLQLAMRYAHLCHLISVQGIDVAIATISLFKEVHTWNRTHLPGYLEVYLKVPMEELRRRDPKGIYRRFDAGELSDVAGLDLPIDEPEAADFIVEFEPGQTLDTVLEKLIHQLKKKRLYED